MSDILPSTASPSTSSASAAPHPSAPATTAPLSSEGPTLPILGASQASSEDGSGRKRKRTTTTTTATCSAVSKEGMAAGGKRTPRAPGRTNHASLYAPWELLPQRERRAVENEGTGRVEVLVWTRNQNVRAGVNRLKTLLSRGGVGETDQAEGDEGDGEGEVVAVSAQGEGTVKLVGIVDVALRVVAGRQDGGEGEGDEAQGGKWFVYTVLSSVLVPRGRKDGGDEAAEGKEGEGDAMDVDGDGDGAAGGGAVQEVKQAVGEGMKKIPVLTVWMSRRRMVGWKEVFGEREVVA